MVVKEVQETKKCRSSKNVQLPNQFIHLILAPSEESKWVDQKLDWVKQTHDEKGRMRVDFDSCIRLCPRKAAYDYEQLRELASQVPIYYRSWGQMCEAFESASRDYNDRQNLEHWERIVDEIKKLVQRASKYK